MLPSTPTLALEIPKAYSMPAASPLYRPPPFKFQDCRMATIIFKTTAETLKRLVPAPLKPNPDQLISVYYGLFHDAEPAVFDWKEVGLVVPVTHGDTSGLYFTHMYQDTDSIAIAREIWGFPTKEAVITITEASGEFSTVVSRQGATLLKATMRPEIRVEEVPPTHTETFFNLKLIPSVKRGAPPDVLQLTATPVVQQATELHTGPGTLQLGTSPEDQLGDIPVLEVVSAQFEVMGQTLDCGEVAFDYLAHH